MTVLIKHVKMFPFTVVRDWAADWFEPGADKLRRRHGEEPQVFHVWAKSADDASDEAESLAIAKFGERAAEYLHPVVVLQGHAYFAEH